MRTVRQAPATEVEAVRPAPCPPKLCWGLGCRIKAEKDHLKTRRDHQCSPSLPHSCRLATDPSGARLTTIPDKWLSFKYTEQSPYTNNLNLCPCPRIAAISGRYILLNLMILGEIRRANSWSPKRKPTNQRVLLSIL